jgi:hypothetical protein
MPKTVLTVLSAAICLMLNPAPTFAADQLQLRQEHRRAVQERPRETGKTPPATSPAQGASTWCGKDNGDETGLCGNGWSKYSHQSEGAQNPEADRLRHPLMALLVMLAIQKTGAVPAAFVERD